MGLNCLVDKVDHLYLLCETRNKQKNSYLFDFEYAWILGKVSNSIYYQFPIKVDFTKAFNMKAFYNILKVIFKYFFQIRLCCDYFIIINKDYFFILDNFISKVRFNSFSEMFVCIYFHVEMIIQFFLIS